MVNYLALASTKAYLFDVLVWVIIGTIVTIFYLALFKRTKFFLAVLGVLLIASSMPIAVMSELSINGCCGAPSTGHEGLGYVIGGVVACLGVGLVLFGKKLAKQRQTKSKPNIRK